MGSPHDSGGRRWERAHAVDDSKRIRLQNIQDQNHHSSIQNSLTKLRNLVFGGPFFAELQLNNCEIGDFGFQTIIKGLNKLANSEDLTLGLSKNLLTNESIKWLTGVYLSEKPSDYLNLYTNSNAMAEFPYESNNAKKLRLKKLDLSNNFLRTT